MPREQAMELVQEVQTAVHATANPEFAAWVRDDAGVDLAPLALAGTSLQAWVVSPRAARPPVGFLVVRAGDALVVTTGDAAAAGRALAAAGTVPDAALPGLLFELVRSRARATNLVTTGDAAPSVSRDASRVQVVLRVERGRLPPERWVFDMDGGALVWTRAEVSR